MSLSIVVLNFRTPKRSVKTLEGVLASAIGVCVEGIIVDNGSGDGSAEQMRQLCPDARVVELPANAGFAAGMNAGVRESKGEYVLLLNSDVDTLPGSVAALVDFLRDNSDVGLVAPVLVDHAGDISRTLLLQPTPARLLAPLVGKWQYKNWCRRIGNQPLDVEATEGAAIMVSRRAIELAGLLDEDFFFYHEIVEWCMRIRERGLRVVVLPNARMTHGCGESTEGVRSAARVELKRSEYQLVRKKLGGFMCALVKIRDMYSETLSVVFYGAFSLLSLGKWVRGRQKLRVHLDVLKWLLVGMPRRTEGRYKNMFGNWD